MVWECVGGFAQAQEASELEARQARERKQHQEALHISRWGWIALSSRPFPSLRLSLCDVRLVLMCDSRLPTCVRTRRRIHRLAEEIVREIQNILKLARSAADGESRTLPGWVVRLLDLFGER